LFHFVASLAVGVRHSFTAAASGIPPSAYLFVLSLALSHVGVGHNPYPVAFMRCTNGASWYAVPFRVIPERGQVPKNSLKPPVNESCDVFHDDEAWSYFANNSGVFRP
jgi:hypothetical protein